MHRDLGSVASELEDQISRLTIPPGFAVEVAGGNVSGGEPRLPPGHGLESTVAVVVTHGDGRRHALGCNRIQMAIAIDIDQRQSRGRPTDVPQVRAVEGDVGEG